MTRKITIYAFIDASNLFYGGEKSLGWKIDYQRLFEYLQHKYFMQKAYYFGGIDSNNPNARKFYRTLRKIGYDLHLKPVKVFRQKDGSQKRKANCDVDMTLYLMKEKENFDRAIILSGDGDFLSVLRHLRNTGKEVIVISRRPRTAREIKKFAKANFRDFEYLRELLRERNKRTAPI